MAERRNSQHRFACHCFALLTILVLLIPVVDNGSFANPDEGLYTAQAASLGHGSWVRERPAVDVDANGRWTGLLDEVVHGTESIPYARRPLFPIVLTPFWQLGGVGGGMLLSVVAAWTTAVLAALTAHQINQRAQLWTLWLIGVGSPVFYDAYLVMAHSLATAMSAALVLAVVTLLRSRDDVALQVPRRFWTWAVAGWAVAIPLTLIRTEGILVVGALAIAVAAIGCNFQHPLRMPSRRLLTFAVGLGIVGAITYLANDAWARSISGDLGGSSASGINRSPNPLAVIWSGLLRPWHPDNRFASAAMALISVAAVAAPIVLRTTQRYRSIGISLLILAAGASVLRLLQEPPGLISGFFPTMPWLVIGLLSLGGPSARARTTLALATAASALVVGILNTSYGIGGINEWGGRFFHVAIPMLAPLAAVGLIHMSRALPHLERRIIICALLCITLCISGSALRAQRYARQVTLEMRAFTTSVADISGTHLAVVVQLTASGAQRMLWLIEHDGVDLLTSDGIANLHLFLNDVPPSIDRVVAISDAPPTVMEATIMGANDDWRIDSIRDGPGELMNAFVLSRQ